MQFNNLKEELLKEHSKIQCNLIVSWVGNSQNKFDELFNLFISDNYRIVQRAACPIGYCIEKKISFINKNWNPLIKKLNEPNLHNAVKRNILRILQNIKIPKKHQGFIMQTCFIYLQSPNEPVAVKAFSISVLSNLSLDYPEILPELKIIINEQIHYQSPAFKVRAKKIFNF